MADTYSYTRKTVAKIDCFHCTQILRSLKCVECPHSSRKKRTLINTGACSNWRFLSSRNNVQSTWKALVRFGNGVHILIIRDFRFLPLVFLITIGTFSSEPIPFFFCHCNSVFTHYKANYLVKHPTFFSLPIRLCRLFLLLTQSPTTTKLSIFIHLLHRVSINLQAHTKYIQPECTSVWSAIEFSRPLFGFVTSNHLSEQTLATNRPEKCHCEH